MKTCFKFVKIWIRNLDFRGFWLQLFGSFAKSLGRPTHPYGSFLFNTKTSRDSGDWRKIWFCTTSTWSMPKGLQKSSLHLGNQCNVKMRCNVYQVFNVKLRYCEHQRFQAQWQCVCLALFWAVSPLGFAIRKPLLSCQVGSSSRFSIPASSTDTLWSSRDIQNPSSNPIPIRWSWSSLELICLMMPNHPNLKFLGWFSNIQYESSLAKSQVFFDKRIWGAFNHIHYRNLLKKDSVSVSSSSSQGESLYRDQSCQYLLESQVGCAVLVELLVRETKNSTKIWFCAVLFVVIFGSFEGKIFHPSDVS